MIEFRNYDLKGSGAGTLFLRDGVPLNLKELRSSGHSPAVVRGLVLRTDVEKEKGEEGKAGDPPKKRVVIMKKQDGETARIESDAIELQILVAQEAEQAKLEAVKAEKLKADAVQAREKALEKIKVLRLEEARKTVPARSWRRRKGSGRWFRIPKPPRLSARKDAGTPRAAVKELHETAQKLTEQARQPKEAMDKMETHEQKADDRAVDERRSEAEAIKRNLDRMVHDLQERAREIEKDARPQM